MTEIKTASSPRARIFCILDSDTQRVGLSLRNAGNHDDEFRITRFIVAPRIALMASLLAGVFVLMFAGLLSADPLPNRQRRLAIEQLATTPAGVRLLEDLDARGWNPYESISFFALEDKNCAEPYSLDLKTNHLQIHCNFLSASPTYLSWVFAQALIAVRAELIADHLGARGLPVFLDVGKWSFVVAMQHWMELGSPNAEDFAEDPISKNRKFARKMKSSTTDWTQKWREKDLSVFLSAVEQRDPELNKDAIEIDEYVRRPDVSRKQRQAAEAIKMKWQAALADECSRATRRCPW